MANKKASGVKKPVVVHKSATAKPATTTTKVTTVKAVEAASPSARRFNFRRSTLVGAGIAEFIGTFLIASAVLAGQGQPIWVLFTIVGITLIIGGLSGAHVNPIVTVGSWVTRKISASRAVVYLVAQILGALLAYVVMSAYVQHAPEVSQQAAQYGQSAAELFKANAVPAGKEWGILFAELLGSTIFAFAMASAVRAKSERTAAAFTAGLGFFIALLIAGSAASVIGGTAILNPAVAISLQAYSVKELAWPIAIYAVVPLLGGVLGFFLRDILRADNDTFDDGDQLVRA